MSEQTLHPKVKDVLPDLHEKILRILERCGDASLMALVDNLQVFQMCGCGAKDCGSFWTMIPPIDDSDDNDLDVGIIHDDQHVLIEVYDGNKIGYIEIIPSEYGREVQQKLRDALGWNSK